MQTDNPTPEAAMVEVRRILSAVNVSDMVGKCGWKTWEQARDGLLAAINDLASPPPVTGGEGALREAANLSELATTFEAPGRITHPTGPNSEVAAMLRRAAAALATPATGGTFADGVEARDPHSVEWNDLVAAIKNDGMLFEQFATRMFECWRGTGTLMEEGSASNDYRVWGNEAHNRFLHLKALLRDIHALQLGAGREDGA